MSDSPLSHTAVLGAYGKMGSGICMVLLVAMVEEEIQQRGKIGSYRLHLTDTNDQATGEILVKLRKHVRAYAEKNLQAIRQLVKDNEELIENHEIIEDFIQKVLSMIRISPNPENLSQCKIIFEAATENFELKTKIIQMIKNSHGAQPWFFTNTSSIPIKAISEATKTQGNIIGYHFYNPPHLQKLVELVIPQDTNKELSQFTHTLTKKIKKITIPANDTAGFIGNGHFMREILLAESMLKIRDDLSKEVEELDHLTRDGLIRPMGIFQLIDYVGLDVCSSILNVMGHWLKDKSLHSPLLEALLERNIRGGQNPDGSQKSGFFQYEKNKITGVYDWKSQKYIPPATTSLSENFQKISKNYTPWRNLLKKSPQEKEDLLNSYFTDLKKSDEPSAKTAMSYLLKSRSIAEGLVKDQVAANINDVNQVLLLGFGHAYGPGNIYY